MKDIIVRAIKTFIQGFLGALAVSLPTTDINNSSLWKSILIGACAGGISAVMNFVIGLLKKEEK